MKKYLHVVVRISLSISFFITSIIIINTNIFYKIGN